MFRFVSRTMVFIGLLLFCNATTMATASYSCPYCHEISESCYSDEIGAIYCKERLMTYPKDQELEVYHVKDGTLYIAEGAFSENSYIKQVIIPDGVVKIEKYAF